MLLKIIDLMLGLAFSITENQKKIIALAKKKNGLNEIAMLIINIENTFRKNFISFFFLIVNKIIHNEIVKRLEDKELI